MSDSSGATQSPSAPSTPPTGTDKKARPKPPRGPSPRRSVLAPLALIVALIALVCVGFGGWHWWQGRQGRQQAAAVRAQALASVQQQVASVQAAQHKDAADRAQGRQASHAASQAMGQRLDGVSNRVDSLEHAVAGLARHNQRGRRALLLDQTQMLLRMGKERYALFHDAAGALKAYTLADQTLAAIGDPALAGVRRSVDDARKTLAAMRPATREQDLAALAHLRDALAQWPLKSLDTSHATPHGFWQRLWHAVSTAVVVRRVDGSAYSLADQRLTRHLVALDVAEAEAARVAWDSKAFHAALERVDHALAVTFDGKAAGVRTARAMIKQMLAEPVAAYTPPELDKALEQLRNLRAVRGAAAMDTTPAPTTSAAASRAPATAGSAP